MIEKSLELCLHDIFSSWNNDWGQTDRQTASERNPDHFFGRKDENRFEFGIVIEPLFLLFQDAGKEGETRAQMKDVRRQLRKWKSSFFSLGSFRRARERERLSRPLALFRGIVFEREMEKKFDYSFSIELSKDEFNQMTRTTRVPVKRDDDQGPTWRFWLNWPHRLNQGEKQESERKENKEQKVLI